MNNFVLIKQLPLKFNILKKKSQSIIYFKLLTIVITILSCAVSSWGQTIRTVGTGGNYSSLRLACQAITSGTLTGNIELQIKSSIIETNSIIIPASGTGSASYSSVKIYPIGSGYTISGTIAGPLISLNSADNITFDGRVNQTGSTEDLTISNLSTGNETTNCTFRFINSAENNSVKYCTVKGASLSVTGGIILFSTSTSGNGNDNNTIDNCNITNAGGNRPLNAILSSANSTALNSTCTISNNNIYDFFNASTNSFGINISQFSSGWSITGNSFYETATFTPSQSRIYTCLYIGYSSGNNFTVTGNYIGGKATQCEGTAWTVNTSTYGFEFHGIEIMLGTTPASNFQNNTITNISFTSRDTQFYGIFISSGDLNIGTTSGNTIGSSTGTGSITLTSSLNTSTSYGIYNNNSAGTSTLQNNIIGSITTIGTADYSHSFTAIKNVSAQTTIISNNIIGSTATANSIQASYSTTSTNAQNVYGINSTGSGTTTISGNTISNMHNASLYTTSGQISGIFTSAGVNTISNNIVRNLSSTNPNTNATTTASVVGILQTSTADNQTISGNSIYSLSNTNTGNVVVSVIGIYYSGPTTGTNSISKTFINNLTLSSGSATAKIFGIRIGSGTTTYSNNVINIGTGITSSYLIYGLYETGAASNNNYVYFNTVYLNGSPASGSANTYAFWSNANTNTRNFRNNIFYNARSNNGASGKHFAAYFNYANNASLTLSNNDYFVDGTGGVLGYSNGADKTALPIVATKDANSSIVNPNFIKVISPPSYYLNSAIETGGVTGTGILTDYEGTTRRSGASPNTPSMGAFESPLATIPVAPIAVNNSRCGTGSVSISATPGSAQTIDWYNVSSGGTVLANGSGTTTFNTPGISSTTSYYAEARNITTGATSSTRTEVTATINNAPSEPGEITGVTSVCSGQEGVTYSINPVDGATGYTWSVPSDASITDGTGTTDITVTFGSTSGDISVSADNSCSSIAVSTLITVNALPTPTFTSEPGASACADIDVTYATETDNTDYVWSITGTLNTDYTITSGGTVTDYSVTIKWLTAGNKIVTVNYSDANGCPSATPASSIETIVNVAPLPPFTEEPGASTCIDTDVTYTTESDNTNYLWSVPGTLDIDYTITSGGTASDNTLIVKWLTTGSKTVTVNYTDANGCSAATPSSSTATTVNSAPSQPGTITGLTTVSSGQTGVTYSISSVSGATGYTWSVPSGASITAGSGTTAITVTFGSVSGNVSVTADNSCGSSTARNLAITVNGCSSPAQPGTITGLTTVSSGQTGVTYSISSVSGATGYTWSVPSGASITAGTGTTNITVTFGSSSGNVGVTADNSCGSSTARTSAITVGVPPSGFVWTAGANSTDWNDPLNWSGLEVPTNADDVTIPTHPANGDIFPAISNDAQCNDITINSGASLTISTGNTLSISGNFTNNGNINLGLGTYNFIGSSSQTVSGTNKFENLTINNSNGITLNSNTSVTGIVTTTTGALNSNGKLTLLSIPGKTAIISGTGSGNISGNVNVQRYLGTITGYYYLSSPVIGTFQQVANNMAVIGWGSEYKSGGWSNLWKYDESDISQITHPDGVRMNGWITPSGSSVQLTPMEGFAVYVDPNKTFTYTGSVNNGSINIPLTNTISTGVGGSMNDDGWNLVGNPYPCPINWDAPTGWTKTNVADALYFYCASGQYKTYINGIGTPSGVNGRIASGQGFFVKAIDNGSLNVTNDARIDITTPTFYKKDNDKQMIRIKGYYANSPDLSDETVVYFDANAQKSVNPYLDAYKLMNFGESQTNLYTTKTNKDKLAINSQPLISDEEVIIPLALNVKQTGSFIINATEITNLAPETQVFLVDLVLNKIQNLNENPEYKFNVNANITEGRFYLRVAPKSSKADTKTQSDNNLFYTYTTNKVLNVSYNNTLNKQATLDIYNLLGQNVINTQLISNGNHQYNLNRGCYIIRLVSDNKVNTKKITIE